jgi:hypothetical protein
MRKYIRCLVALVFTPLLILSILICVASDCLFNTKCKLVVPFYLKWERWLLLNRDTGDE